MFKVVEPKRVDSILYTMIQGTALCPEQFQLIYQKIEKIKVISNGLIYYEVIYIYNLTGTQDLRKNSI